MYKLYYFIFLSVVFCFCSNSPSIFSNEKGTPSSAFLFNPITESQKEYYLQQLYPLYQNVLLNSGFHGGIIIAKNGQIIFEDYRGIYNNTTKALITASTPLHIASVSKTFTAMTILKLMEEGKIDIDNEVKLYIPSFPYTGITVKMLLNHRSGLSNYVYDLDGTVTVTYKKKNRRGKWITYNKTVKDNTIPNKLLSNDDVLMAIAQKKVKQERTPNTHFKYCNTNYLLLASIIEKVTGIDFPTYMKQNVFEPLGMKNTFVFSVKDSANYNPSYKYNFIPYHLEKLDCTYGDKNIYSTPQDILQWDKALYSNSFVSAATLQKAYTPYSFERPGIHNYGLGWRLLTYPQFTIPYHNGWWHGNNAVFTRLTKDTATIIVLGNKYNDKIYKAKEFAAIFNHNSPMADTARLEE
ncbi:MAG: serine hydrolase domain-containing protein [Chitinophagaceae bacterium]